MNNIIKISAAGNKFLIADSRWFQNQVPSFLLASSFQVTNSFKDFLNLSSEGKNKRAEILKNILSSQEASYTDGLIVLRDFESSTPQYDFYNCDGSQPEMCGNAACCLLFYGEKTNIPFDSFWLSKEKIQSVKNLKDDYAISLSTVPRSKGLFKLQFRSQEYEYNFMESGVPHGVLEWKADFKKEKFKRLAKNIRFKNPFNDQGMNVSFYQVKTDNQLQAITFERGVEDFTSACGTGALAIAFAFANKYPEKRFEQIFVNMPGGLLTVQIKPPVCLSSPVKWGY